MKKLFRLMIIVTFMIVMLPATVMAGSEFVINGTSKATLVSEQGFIEYPIVFGSVVNVERDYPSDARFYECNYNGSKLLVRKDQVISRESFNTQESSFKLLREISVDENYKEYKRDSKGISYPIVELMNKKYTNDPTDKIVDNFTFDANLTNSQKLDYLVGFLNEQGYTYDFNGPLEGIDKQVSNIGNKKTKCFGITYLGAKMLDKMDVPYRIIHVAHYNPATGKTDYSKTSHIYLEAQLENGKFVNFDLTDLVLCKCYYKDANFTKRILAEVMKSDNADIRKEVSRLTKNGDSTIIIRQSPTYRSGALQGNSYKIFVKTGLTK